MPDNFVLFVDDENSILNSIERLFYEDNISILKANSAEEAMGLMKNENIAVLVSDNFMPGMKGVELLSKAKVIAPNIVRILMTGQADLPTAIDAINNGEVFRFVMKPWDDDVFRQTVKAGIERHQIIRSLKKGDESTMLSLARTIELKDSYTKGHCDRVAYYALIIAKALNFSEEAKREIRYGSWLHDCGKIGIPESILNKQGSLDDDEFEIIKKHPVWGGDVANQARLPEAIINIILYHHERYDGKGYPSGIHGEKIPVEARIVSVADCFDALTTNRPYRNAYSKEKGIEIILSMRGKNFDPEVADLFIANLEMNASYEDTLEIGVYHDECKNN